MFCPLFILCYNLADLINETEQDKEQRPRVLKTFWEKFKAVMRAIGNFQARVLLSILYVVLALPTGALLRLFSDPLDLHHAPVSPAPTDVATFWQERQPLDETLNGARLQS